MAASDRAYAHTKERILDGRYPGGLLISEGDVAARVDISRTPVREAFLRLESEGLLELYPKRGALVVPVSREEVESVMETRLLVERHAVEKVIEEDIDLEGRPAAAIARLEKLAGKDSRDFVDADREFHRIYVAAMHNPILLGMHDSLRDRQSRMNLVALARDTKRLKEILGEHRQIAAAVEARDLEGARAIVDQHLGTTLSLLRQGFERLEGAD